MIARAHMGTLCNAAGLGKPAIMLTKSNLETLALGAMCSTGRAPALHCMAVGPYVMRCNMHMRS